MPGKYSLLYLGTLRQVEKLGIRYGCACQPSSHTGESLMGPSIRADHPYDWVVMQASISLHILT